MNKILATLLITGALLTAYANSIAMTLHDQNAILQLHNQLRAAHNSPPMQWDEKLASYAAKHASLCQFKHSYGEYGENIAAGYPSPLDAINAWYAEVKDYAWENASYSAKTGHFTQLIWKSSTHLGCAVVTCNGKNGTPGDFLVCEYNPPGNITNDGYFMSNVTQRITEKKLTASLPESDHS